MDPPPRMCIGKMVEGSSCKFFDGDGVVVVSLLIVVVAVVSHLVDIDDWSQDR